MMCVYIYTHTHTHTHTHIHTYVLLLLIYICIYSAANNSKLKNISALSLFMPEYVKRDYFCKG